MPITRIQKLKDLLGTCTLLVVVDGISYCFVTCTDITHIYTILCLTSKPFDVDDLL